LILVALYFPRTFFKNIVLNWKGEEKNLISFFFFFFLLRNLVEEKGGHKLDSLYYKHILQSPSQRFRGEMQKTLNGTVEMV